jgi:2-polyprenyl-6-methoxyphenol hydroxylase-like FAD-dependent oxidoreductase
MLLKTSVLIVGAGPVGLATAIELGQRGIACVVLERNDRVGYAPRAKTTNVRTREHFRRWGIAGKLKEASPLGIDYPSNVTFVTRLNGHLLTRFENAFYCAPGKHQHYSEHAQWIPQYSVEEVMRSHLQTLPSVDLRFNCELRSLDQDANGVHAVATDTANKSDVVVDCDYLVGADGARSFVRNAIGAKMHGTYGLSRNYNVVFRAPGLAQAHSHGPAIMYWQVNSDVPSLIGPMDRGDKWFFMPTNVPEGMKLGDLDAPSLIRKSTGIDLPYEVLSTDEWVASRLIGDRYSDRRVFLAGDACHLHPPFGGYGMNMGVADGVDLGWKLAAVVQGWGGKMLLDSYEIERRPVHEMVMDEAVANHALLGNQLWQPGLEDDNEAGAAMRHEIGTRIATAKQREFATLGVVLGYRYMKSPVIAGLGSGSRPARPMDFLNYVPSAEPGCVAPHVWMHDGSSLYDHFGQGFCLVATLDSRDDDIQAIAQAARDVGVPLKLLQPQESSASALYGERYTLVRPDQHVAWRGNDWPADGRQVFEMITGRTPVNAAGEAAP